MTDTTDDEIAAMTDVELAHALRCACDASASFRSKLIRAAASRLERLDADLDARTDAPVRAWEQRDTLRAKLKSEQAIFAERVAEQRAHASAAVAEATRLRGELEALRQVTPLDGDAMRHLVEQLDAAHREHRKQLAEALGMDEGRCLDWSDLLAEAREAAAWAREREAVEAKCREAEDKVHDLTAALNHHVGCINGALGQIARGRPLDEVRLALLRPMDCDDEADPPML